MIWNPWKEIKRLREEAVKLNRDKDNLSAVIQEMKRDAERDKNNPLADRFHKFSIALQSIADEEKPTSNAKVRRMVAIARVALDQ